VAGVETRDLPATPVGPKKDLARTKLLVSVAVGFAVGLPVAFVASAEFLPLVVWDVTCLVFMAWVWAKIWRADSEETAALAVPEDPSARSPTSCCWSRRWQASWRWA